jgi:hypothetical protein
MEFLAGSVSIYCSIVRNRAAEPELGLEPQGDALELHEAASFCWSLKDRNAKPN